MDFVKSPTSNEAKDLPQLSREKEQEIGLYSSHNIVISDHDDAEPAELKKPPLLTHV